MEKKDGYIPLYGEIAEDKHDMAGKLAEEHACSCGGCGGVHCGSNCKCNGSHEDTKEKEA